MKTKNYPTAFLNVLVPRTRREDLILVYLLYLLTLGILWRHSDYFPSFSVPSPTPGNSFKEVAICTSVEVTEASIQPNGTIGSVAIPVGSRITGLKRWSSNASWPGGIKPGPGDDVTIPLNMVLVLDENVSVKSITVKGQLIVDLSKNVSVSTEYLMVMGTGGYFEWGTETEPYQNKGVITLVGNDPTKKIPGTSPAVESKAIMVMEGALMELHGKVKTSWTNLSANASSGGNSITVASNSTNWQVGDVILIAPSRLNENEGEQRTITFISADKRTFTLDSPLKYPHIGQLKTYTRNEDGKVWKGDMRAEVGLLSKSIKIQGDDASDALLFGGHVMIHFTGKAHVNNIELFRMGQKDATGKGILGRYPFHWHLAQENGAGQYLKNTSVHKSFNRAITIHGTESTLVENNFCYDHVGHGIFLEDGSERFNTIRGNVVLLTKRPAPGQEIIPSDNEANTVQNRTPASFWITNPNNIFENNVAAGTEGTGFWFALPRSPMGPSATLPRFTGMEPFKEPLGRFYGNKSHSCASGFDIFDQLTPAHALSTNGAWERTDLRVMDGCTWYACDLAVYGGIGGGRKYTENVVFRNNVFLDNVTAIMHANYSLVEQSVFIANSGEDVFTGVRQLNRGYDGACSIKNCHLVGWQANNANYVQNTGGAMKHVNYRVSGITKDHEGPPRMSFPDYSKIPKGEVGTNAAENPRFWSYIHWDMDGSLGGKPNTSIITNHPLCRDGSEVRYENWTNLYRTDRRFAYMLVDFAGDPKMTLVRTKAGTPKAGQYYINGYYGTFIHFPVMVNDGFLYTLQFESLGTANSFALRMMDDYVAGDEVLYRIKNFGKFTGITVSGATKYNTLTELKSAKQTGFSIDNGDLYIKMVSITASPDIACNVSWTASVAMPILDTDGDGITDFQESVNGTDPISNDPIPEKPPLPVSTCTASINAATTSFCVGGSVTLNASTGVSYKWMNGTTVLSATTASISVTTAGSYTVEVTNAAGCKATSPAKVITVNPTPIASISAPASAFCVGGSVVLTASGGTSYKWMNGTTILPTTAGTHTATEAGSYTVEATNASGCKATSSVKTITVNPLPAATVTAPSTSFCAGSSVVLTASVGNSYKWMNGTTVLPTALATHAATSSGSYTVEVTNASGCKKTSAPLVITANPLPIATIAAPVTSFCLGGSVVLTASAGTSYKWMNGTTVLPATSASHTATVPGSYTVEVTNAAGCKATSAPTVVTINTAPVAVITSVGSSFCTGEAIVLTASPGLSYKWMNGATVLSNNTARYNATTPGSYTVEVTYSGGCKASSPPKVITENSLPSATITAPITSFCAGGSAVLTASPGTSYKWMNGTTVLPTTAATHSATTSGSYTVEVTNAAGCKASSVPKIITANALPIATITAPVTSFCTGGSAILTASAGTSYKWMNGTTILPTTSATYTASASGAYTVEVTNTAGCKATSAVKTITVTAPSTWYADTDGDGKGDPLVTKASCTQPLGYVALAGDLCPTDPLKAVAGNCGCNKTETSCLDCAGVANGKAFKDACGKCAGGTTGVVPVTNAALCGGTTIGINGPSCVEVGKTYTYTLTTENIPVVAVNWWSASGATITEAIGNEKQMTISLPSYVSGSTTITAGVNFSTNPWYKDYSLLIKVGGCVANAASSLKVEASPLPFDETTVLNLENQEIISSVVVMDLNGVELYRSENINASSFELGKELAAGMYVVYVHSSHGISMKKLMKLN